MSLESKPGTLDAFLVTLAFGDVLEKFRALPESARREFEEWIAKAEGETAHQRRIDILVMALRSAPRLHGQVTTPSLTDTK